MKRHRFTSMAPGKNCRPEDLPSMHLERDVRHGDGGAVAFLEVRDLDDGVDHVCPTGANGWMFILCSTDGHWVS